MLARQMLTKNAIGSNWAIKKRKFRASEKGRTGQTDRLVQQNVRAELSGCLMALEQIVSDRKDLRFRSWMLDEAILRGIEFTSVPTQTEVLIDA